MAYTKKNLSKVSEALTPANNDSDYQKVSRDNTCSSPGWSLDGVGCQPWHLNLYTYRMVQLCGLLGQPLDPIFLNNLAETTVSNREIASDYAAGREEPPGSAFRYRSHERLPTIHQASGSRSILFCYRTPVMLPAGLNSTTLPRLHLTIKQITCKRSFSNFLLRFASKSAGSLLPGSDEDITLL